MAADDSASGRGTRSSSRARDRHRCVTPKCRWPLQTRRVVSVDALRGFNIFWIIGGDGAIWALADMCAARARSLSAVGGFLGTQFSHVAWEGFRFYDFIFPLFIFVTGVSIVLSLPRLVEREGKRQGAYRACCAGRCCSTAWG